ncbi:MAG: alternative ribosome rescue aminoacyl-tRNA hydrolase ArfB [Acidimicrobiia bacterium]|nr:alternative ribosome rescue aminoacyl-tRNA hydrolase ArfB [Acidimicrobiia bacterium]
MIIDGHHIPDSELEWTFGPSGGPGGQHANRAHTRAEVRFDLAGSQSLPDPLKEHMLRRLGSRAAKGVVMVSADDTRSQLQNRRLAHQRLALMLHEAARRPRNGRQTRPNAASRDRRLESKRRRGQVKQDRRQKPRDGQ